MTHYSVIISWRWSVESQNIVWRFNIVWVVVAAAAAAAYALFV
jgi:hypothetical protein